MARSLGVAAIAMAIQAFVPASSAAQVPLRIDGTVRDASGAPLGGVPVILHRMTQTRGARLGEDTTDLAGRFAFEVPDPGDDAVHFAAVRYAGAVFVGPLIDGSGSLRDPYPITVRDGVPEGAVVLADGTVMASGTLDEDRARAAAAPVTDVAPPDRGTTAAVFLLLAAVAVAIAAWSRSRSRRRSRREALLELALLEAGRRNGRTSRHPAGSPRTGDGGDALAERREELRERVRALASR